MTSTDFDPVMFEANQAAFPEEQLRLYWGRHVAWNFEGTRILADGSTGKELDGRLKELGIDSSLTVDSYVFDPNLSLI